MFNRQVNCLVSSSCRLLLFIIIAVLLAGNRGYKKRLLFHPPWELNKRSVAALIDIFSGVVLANSPSLNILQQTIDYSLCC